MAGVLWPFLSVGAVSDVARFQHDDVGCLGMRKYRRLKGHKTRGSPFIEVIAQRQPALFVYWQRGMIEAFARWGQCESRGSRMFPRGWGCDSLVLLNTRCIGCWTRLPGRRHETSYWLRRGELRSHPPHRLEPSQTGAFQRKSQAETLQGRIKQ